MVRLDPADPNHPHSLIRLSDEFAAAAERGLPTPAHHSWGVRVAALFLVIATMWGFGVAVGAPSASADVSVVIAAGLVDVELRTDAAPSAVVAALRDAGIDAQVVGVPTGPSAVGRFVRLSSNAPSERIGCRTDPCHTRRIRFTEGSTTTISVGVPAKGRPYEHLTDGFDDGEPFEALAHLRGQPFDAALAELRAHADTHHIELDVAAGEYTTVTGVAMTSPRSATVLGS